MDARELLGMLTIKGQSFTNASPSFSRLSPQDIAHALALIQSPPARLYARVKYADQQVFASELATELLYYCSHIEGFGKWKVRPGNLQSICALALYEAINPHICPWCHGRGEAVVEARVIQCDGCRASGRRSLTDSDRARLVNITKSSWSETWTERYRSIQGIVDKWEDIVAGALSVRLRQTEPSAA